MAFDPLKLGATPVTETKTFDPLKMGAKPVSDVNYTHLEQQVAPKEDGFFKSLAKSAIRPFLEVGASAYNVGSATKKLLQKISNKFQIKITIKISPK